MSHFTLYRKPEKLWKEFFLPFICQFILVVLAILPHRLSIGLGAFVLPQSEYLGEMTSPTTGRLVFAVCAMLGCFVLGYIAHIFAQKDKDLPAFLIGIFAGTLLWQSLGEDLWHFGIYVDGTLVNFLKLESIQVLPIVLPVLIAVLFGMLHHSFDFGVLCVIASFLCNWMGHYCSHATYPLVAGIMDISKWYVISGIGFGGALFLLGLYLGIAASVDRKGRMFSSIICYLGIAIFVFGMIG